MIVENHLYTSTTHDIQVEITPKYVEANSNPEANNFFFSYEVSITNHGRTPKKLVSRHWIITNGWGEVEHVRGPGVVGLQPIIKPNETFRYSSFCPLPTPTGNMRGSYQFLDDKNKSVDVEIPLFFLRHPGTFH